MGRALRQQACFVELEDELAVLLREIAAIEDILSGLGAAETPICDERIVFIYLADRMAAWRVAWEDYILRIEEMSLNADNENVK